MDTSLLVQSALCTLALGLIWWLSKQVFTPAFSILMTLLTLGYLTALWL